MGGIGKTELALQYALTYGDEYPGSLCWFSLKGENLATQIIEFARIYFDLVIPQELKSDIARVEYCWREWRTEASLIVLDDVPNYGQFYRQQIAPYLPPAASNIKVLMTSRERPGANISLLNLSVFSETKALGLLGSFIGRSRIEAELNLAKQICNWLGCLPLGLELVGRYIALDKNLKLEKALKRLERKKLHAMALLGSEQADMTAQLGVAAALDLSWDVLDPEAQKLGCYLGLFASEPFKWSWVEAVWIETDDKDKREDEIEDLERLRNLQLIQRNLLKTVPKEETYQLHPLIAQYFKAKLELQAEVARLKYKFSKAVNTLARLIPEDLTIADILKFSITIPHLNTVAIDLTEYVEDNNLFSLFMGIVRFYSGQGIYKQAEHWLELSLNVCRNRFGEYHPSIAANLNNLVPVYLHQGKYDEAEKLCLQAVEMTKQIYVEQHPYVAISLDNLASVYNHRGQYDKAEKLYLQVLKIPKLLGNSDPDNIYTLNNLGSLYKSKGQYNKAEEFYLQALKLSQQLLGKRHQNVFGILLELECVYESLGKYKAAENIYLQFLE